MADLDSLRVGIEVDTAGLKRTEAAARRLDVQLAQLSRGSTEVTRSLNDAGSSGLETKIEELNEQVIELTRRVEEPGKHHEIDAASEAIDTFGERLENAFERSKDFSHVGASIGAIAGIAAGIPGGPATMGGLALFGAAAGGRAGRVAGAGFGLIEPGFERMGEAASLMADESADRWTVDAEEAAEKLEHIARALEEVDRRYARLAEFDTGTARANREGLAIQRDILLQQQAEMTRIAGAEFSNPSMRDPDSACLRFER